MSIVTEYAALKYFFSVDHNNIFDHKYCIDPGNLLSIWYSILTYQYLP